MIELQGKTALITGGSRGIGRATAILFAQAGADVAINYASREAAAKEVKGEVESRGRKCLLLKADICRQEEVVRMVEIMVEELAAVDILVNNAGIWTYGEIGNMASDTWEETIRANLDSVFLSPTLLFRT